MDNNYEMKRDLIIRCMFMIAIITVFLLSFGISEVKAAQSFNLTVKDTNGVLANYSGTGKYQNGKIASIKYQIAEGQSLKGWLVNKNDGYEALPENFDFSKISVDRDMEFMPNSDYVITLDLNGGTSLDGNQITYDMTTQTFTLDTPTYTGHEFLGWTGSNGETPQKVVTIEQYTGGNRNYTAQWSENAYIIKYDSNKPKESTSEVEGSMEDEIWTYSEEKELTANAYSLNSYKFVGWNTKPNGSGVNYEDKEKVSQLTTVNNGTVTLYAQWAQIVYIIYDCQHGTAPDPYPVMKGTVLNNLDDDTLYEIEDARPTDIPAGIYFDGWNFGEYYTTPITEDIHVPAYFDADEYYVSIDNYYWEWEWEEGDSDVTIDYIEAEFDMRADREYTIETPSDADQLNGKLLEFVGYKLYGTDDEPVNPLVIPKYIDHDLHYVAVWRRIYTSVTFHASTNPPNGSGYIGSVIYDYWDIERSDYLLPKKSGYQFTGWSTNEDLSGDVYSMYTRVYDLPREKIDDDHYEIHLYPVFIPLPMRLKINSTSCSYINKVNLYDSNGNLYATYSPSAFNNSNTINVRGYKIEYVFKTAKNLKVMYYKEIDNSKTFTGVSTFMFEVPDVVVQSDDDERNNYYIAPIDVTNSSSRYTITIADRKDSVGDYSWRWAIDINNVSVNDEHPTFWQFCALDQDGNQKDISGITVRAYSSDSEYTTYTSEQLNSEPVRIYDNCKVVILNNEKDNWYCSKAERLLKGAKNYYHIPTNFTPGTYYYCIADAEGKVFHEELEYKDISIYKNQSTSYVTDIYIGDGINEPGSDDGEVILPPPSILIPANYGVSAKIYKPDGTFVEVSSGSSGSYEVYPNCKVVLHNDDYNASDYYGSFGVFVADTSSSTTSFVNMEKEVWPDCDSIQNNMPYSGGRRFYNNDIYFIVPEDAGGCSQFMINTLSSGYYVKYLQWLPSSADWLSKVVFKSDEAPYAYMYLDSFAGRGNGTTIVKIYKPDGSYETYTPLYNNCGLNYYSYAQRVYPGCKVEFTYDTTRQSDPNWEPYWTTKEPPCETADNARSAWIVIPDNAKYMSLLKIENASGNAPMIRNDLTMWGEEIKVYLKEPN